MVSWWSRMRIAWRSDPDRVAVAFMPSMMAKDLGQWVEQQAGRHLRVEERRLRRHVHARRGDVPDLLDRGAAREERGVVLAALDELQRLLVGARVAEAVEVGDGVL